ncbi:MAG: two-component regulator propeller domain-containing protein [Bacteroidota bacterium]
MKNNAFWFFLKLFILSVVFFSCEKKKSNNSSKKISFKSPVTISGVHPGVTYLDTCPLPNSFIIPTKGKGSYTIKTKSGLQNLNLIPPVNTPLLGGEAGGYTFMQNYNTEQGLALSGLFCGYRDKLGNLWFGTQGGGVSRYDGKAFTNYTMAQGLPSNNILCIAEDKKGNFWFGTYGGGVSCYDGRSFTNFSSAHGLASNVTDITEDKNGVLWFGLNGGGVRCYDGKSFSTPPLLKRLESSSVLNITEDKIGNLWFGTSGIGVYCYDRKSLVSINTAHGLAYNFVWPITQDTEENMWFGTYGGGISRFGKDGIGLVEEKKVIPKGSEQDTKINEKLVKNFTTYSTAQGLVNNVIKCITEDKTGGIWFGTEGGGVSRYSKLTKGGEATFTNFTTAQGLSNNTIWSITADKTGNLWFGTEGAGICRYDGSAVTSYTTANGLGNNKVTKIIEDKLGNLWFGTQESGVSRYDGNVLTNFTLLQGFPDNNVTGMFADSKGNIWFGYSDGVSRCKYTEEGEKILFTNYSAEQGFKTEGSVWDFMEDKNGSLWFATNNGVYKYDGKTFINYTTHQGLADNKVWCITEDKNGFIWFGTDEGGLSRYDGNVVDAIEHDENISDQTKKMLKKVNGKYIKSFTNYTTAQGLGNNTVLSAIEDRAGNLWFGTSGGGISKFDFSASNKPGGSSFSNYTTAQGLPDNIVYDIQEDTLHNILWFGTNLGLSGLKLNTKNYEVDKVEFENFNNNTGYPIKDLNTAAMCIDSKGIIWAGTGDKLIRFDYSGINKSTEAQTVLIQNIKINNENISWYDLSDNLGYKMKSDTDKNDSSLVSPNIVEEVTTFGRALTEVQRNTMLGKFSDIEFDSISPFYPLPYNLVLPYNHNNVTFDFAAIEPAKPSLVRYQYILDGYDKEWSPLINKTTVTFGNIHEGNYIFRLKAVSPDGVWSVPVTYTFKVLPPWYRTWWMMLIYITIGFLLIGLYIRWRERKLKHEKLILEEKVELRTKQLDEKSKVVIEKNLQITESINYAKRIQNAILPSQELIKSFSLDSFIFFKPKDIVSGDFYYYHKFEKYTLLACVDCTGHGVPGGFMSTLGTLLLDKIVNSELLSPSEILIKLSDEIIRVLHQQDGGEIQDGMDLSVCLIDSNAKTIEFSGARNGIIIVTNGQAKRYKADSLPVGGNYIKKGIPIERTFKTQNISINQNDWVYMYTDGFMEQVGGEDSIPMNYIQFEKKLIELTNQKTAEEKNNFLQEEIDNWRGKHERDDDILIMGFKII